MNKKVIVFLADGFEECEGLLAVDLLRRAEADVVMASIMGRREVTSAHGIRVQTDALAEEVDFDAADMVVLPGGFDGTERLKDSELVQKQVLRFARDRLVGAICATPKILAGLGLLEGKEATCHPTVEEKMAGAVLTREAATVAGNIITGRSLGTGFEFALKLIEALSDAETAKNIAASIYLD